MEYVVRQLKHGLPNVPIVLENRYTLLVYDINCLKVVNDVLFENLVDIYDIVWHNNHYKINVEYNACLLCNSILGSCNPRQLCGKYYCKNDV
jgi:hypothetical protein